MSKAVISCGGQQFLVAKGDSITVNLLASDKKTVSFKPLAIVDGDKTTIGTPELDKHEVKASIENADFQADKVTAIRYKSKKRVLKKRGHRQRQTTLKITSIS